MEQKKWTEDESNQLLELRKTQSLSFIAKEMRRTKDSIRHRLKLLKDRGTSSIPVTVKIVKKEEEWQEKEVKPLRKKESQYVSYPPLEWCPTCHSPVSNWRDHTSRIGCTRPA